MLSAMVLAAGFGTRLRPLSDELPKPLAPVGDRSVLAHIAARLAAAGVGRAALNVHHLSSRFRNIFSELPIQFEVLHESEILGTAGGVAAARPVLGPGPVLVWNGDVLCSRPPLAELAAQAEAGGLHLVVVPRARGEGSVGLGDQGQVVRVRGEHFGAEVSGGDFIGLSALGRDVLSALPERGCLIGDVALADLRRGRRVHTLAAESAWFDVGDARGLLAANCAWLAEHGLEAWRHPSATLADEVTLQASVVGAGARVLGRGPLDGCLVCAGATVTAPVARAIVTPSGRVFGPGVA